MWRKLFSERLENHRFGRGIVKPRLCDMTIALYQNKSEYNKIGKVLETVETLTGNLRNAVSITKPEIIIERSSPVGFNYCYIPEFNRYYYVDDIDVIRTGLLGVKLSVDVLESFKQTILAQNVIIDKSESKPNFYLPDENLKVNVKTKTDIVNFPSGLLESGEFILITAGGGVTP